MNKREKIQIKALEKAIEGIKNGEITDWEFIGIGEDVGMTEIISSAPIQQVVMNCGLEIDTKEMCRKSGISYERAHMIATAHLDKED